MSDAGRQLGLHRGSPMPASATEVDEILRRVPEVAFAGEFEACLFPTVVEGASPLDLPAHISKVADQAYLQSLRKQLEQLRQRARAEDNGGLEFLAATLSHFLDRMPADRHPLVVALWFRSLARRRGQEDTPRAIAMEMDAYESARGSET
jgi:hypothetical protein